MSNKPKPVIRIDSRTAEVVRYDSVRAAAAAFADRKLHSTKVILTRILRGTVRRIMRVSNGYGRSYVYTNYPSPNHYRGYRFYYEADTDRWQTCLDMIKKKLGKE